MSNHSWIPFPTIQPEETLFSWIAAYGRLAAISEPRAISRRLTGHPTALLRHDFPCRLDELCKRTEGHLGTATELIAHHTLLPYFAPFLSVPAYTSASNAMRTGSSLQIRTMMGLAASRIEVDAPLKACDHCIKRDLQAHHRAVWHRDHQWPTAYLCQEHGSLLKAASPEFHAARRLPLLPPNELPADAWHTHPDLTDPEIVLLLSALQSWTSIFASQSPSSFSAQTLRQIYTLGARQRGWIALDGSIRLLALRDAFAAHYRPLTKLSRFKFLSQTDDRNGGFVGYLLRQYNGLHHPARHISLAAFLFPDWAAFEEARREVPQQARSEAPPERESRRASLHAAFARIRSGESLNAVAQSIGVPTTQLTRHAVKAGIPYERRPRIVGTDTEIQLIAMLARGTDRAAIAKRLSVRPGFIKDYLATKPQLRDLWVARHFERQRIAHRLRLQRTLDRNPGVPIKRIRRLPNNGFQWLYNHDRAWLTEALPAIWKR